MSCLTSFQLMSANKILTLTTPVLHLQKVALLAVNETEEIGRTIQEGTGHALATESMKQNRRTKSQIAKVNWQQKTRTLSSNKLSWWYLIPGL